VPTVTFDFLDRRSAERFAELLDETSGGPRHHSRGSADAELAELVAIGHSLSGARTGVQVDPEFRVGLRAMLVATAERDGIGATAAATEPGGGHAAVRESRRLLGRAAGRRIRARGAIVIGVAAGAMAVSGISAASENATPGDALYGVKRQTERAQLAMAGSDVTRGQLSLDFARTRLAEAAGLTGRGELNDSGDFAGVLDDMDADTRQGVKLLTGSAVTRKDAAPLDRVDGFVAAQRQIFVPMLEKLSPRNRERADASLALLDDVRQRAEALRFGLACDTVTRDGQDALGARLSGCMTGTDATAPEETHTGRGQKADSKERPTGPGDDATAEPEKTDPAAEPGSTGSATAPDQVGPGTGDRTPRAPVPGTSTPADSGADEDAESVLDGLLGGILG
jgi:hypothetical protein